MVPPPCGCREQDGQASGGGDPDGDKWIFNTIREKDPKKCQNGSAQPEEMETDQVNKENRNAAPLTDTLKTIVSWQVQENPKRPLSQSLSTIFSPTFTEVRTPPAQSSGPLESPTRVSGGLHRLLLMLQLKAKAGRSNHKPQPAEELQEAIFLAEETYPGICDSLVAELVQRLQR